MKKFKLNLWSNEEKKKTHQLPPDSAVIDGVDDGCGGPKHGKMLFGIKSYLHQFYLASPNSGNPFVDDVEPAAVVAGGASGGAWYLLPPPPSQRIGLYICRLLTVIGLLLLLGGATGIIIGYCWPPNHWSNGSLETSLMRIAIDQDEDGNFYIPPERFTEFLRDPMHMTRWKVAGFCVFAMGASLMALGLLVPTCAQCLGGGQGRLAAFASEDNTPNEPPIRIYPSAGSKFRVVPAKMTGAHKISPTSGPVPVMEEIAKVQPGKKVPSASPSADDLLFGTGGDSQPLLNR